MKPSLFNSRIVALPGLGKSHACVVAPEYFVDYDVLSKEQWEVKGKDAHVTAGVSEKEFNSKIDQSFLKLKEHNYLLRLATPVFPDDIDTISLVFTMDPDDYIAHLKLEEVNRSDLLEKFSEEELRKWATDRNKAAESLNPEKVMHFKPGDFFSDYLIGSFVYYC